MPTYQYECEGCGHEMEVFQSITDKKLQKCPECKKPKLRRLIGAGAGIIFKGSGFYETDYKQSKSPKTDCPVKKDSSSGHGGSCACCPNNPSK